MSQHLSTGRSRVLIVAVLTLTSAVPRFYDLGSLSFYTDEDFTWLSVQSVLDGEGSRMPTGMPYRRALPLTWANAAVVALIGGDGEAPYRVISAALGTLTPAVLFLTGSALVGSAAALVGSTMLALSEWHVAFSRLARMYVPFLFFFILTAHFLWRWGREARWGDGVLGLWLLTITVSLHILGLIAIQFALVSLVLPGSAAGVGAIIAVVFAAAAVLYTLDMYLVGRPYSELGLPEDFLLEGGSVVASAAGPSGSDVSLFVFILAAVGGALGARWGWQLAHHQIRDRDWLQALAVIAAFSVAGAFTGAGHLWGAGLAGLTAILLARYDIGTALRKGISPFTMLSLLAVGWSVYATTTMGLADGLRRLAMFPFPYFVFFWSQFPGLVILFSAFVLWLVLANGSQRRSGLVGVALAVVLPMAAIGILSAWGGTRYLFEVYPYMLLAAAAVTVRLGTKIAERIMEERAAEFGGLILGLVVALSGITGGEGVQLATAAATMEHGRPINESMHIMPFRPDHREPGLFVRRNRQVGDIVIAEEPNTQTIYAGKVDFWFRRAGDARSFLYLDSEGRPRDKYVNSILLSTVAQLQEVVESAGGRAWFITSGETASLRDWYLSNEQGRWLDSLEATTAPSFTGSDGVTAVYCLNCVR